VPFDITGYTSTLTIKKKYSDTDAEALLIENVTSHIDPTAGETSFTISIAESADFASGTYFYQIELSISTTLLVVVTGEFLVEDKLKD